MCPQNRTYVEASVHSCAAAFAGTHRDPVDMHCAIGKCMPATHRNATQRNATQRSIYDTTHV